jgi:hypothetical protein
LKRAIVVALPIPKSLAVLIVTFWFIDSIHSATNSIHISPAYIRC